MAENIQITLTEKDRTTVKGMLSEATNCLLRIDAEKDAMSDIAARALDEFEIKKATFNKLARTMYKHNYQDLQSENEHFEYLYESLVEGS